MKDEFLQKTAKRALIMGTLLLMAFVNVFAQNYSIKGKLTDEETGQPINKANVFVQGTKKGAQTDSTGVFTITGLENKLYDVAFTCVGFRPIRQTLMAGSEVVSVEMSADPAEIQGVEVYGKKKISPLNDPRIQPFAWKSSITSISSTAIQNIGATNLADALKYNVGGNVTEQGRKRKQFYSVRGQMTNADFAIDGISMYYFLEGPSALSTSAVQEIEITRSSNALLYGFSGLNGVVNIKTKTFNKFETHAQAEYGTFNALNASITHGGKFGGFHYLLSVTRDQTDGPVGRNAAEKSWNIFGKLRYNYKNWLEAEVQQFYIKSMREMAQTVSSAQYPVSVSQMSQLWKYDPLNLSLTMGKIKIKEGSKATTELRYYYVQNKKDWHNRNYVVTKVNGVQTLTSTITDAVVAEPDFVHGVGIVQAISPIANNTFRVGADYYHGVMWTNGVQRKNTISGVILDEHTFGKLNVDAGIKVIKDYYKEYAPGTVKITDQWQPAYANLSFGASYKFNDNTILNYIVNTGTIPAPSGSLQLIDKVQQLVNDEKRTGMDLGIVKRIKGLGDITLSMFYSNRKNAFQYTGVLYTNANTTQSEYLKNLDLRSVGAELAYQSPTFFNIVSVFANAMGQYTSDVTGGQDVKYERVPGFITSGGLNIQKYGFSLNTLGRYVNKYIGDRFIVLKAGQKVYVGDYFNLDVNLNYTIPHLPISLYVKAVNLLDTHYATVSPAYPDYGQRISFGLRASL